MILMERNPDCPGIALVTEDEGLCCPRSLEQHLCPQLARSSICFPTMCLCPALYSVDNEFQPLVFHLLQNSFVFILWPCKCFS